MLHVSPIFSWVQTRGQCRRALGICTSRAQAWPPCFGVWGAPGAQLAIVWCSLSFLSQDYYGKRLQKSEDLRTNACVTSAVPVPKAVRDALKLVHEEVVAR